ncbi:MAG: hypothetical protein A3I05_06070 [Deltaproteobacteria bacterium RIFCSPLOWO2_02_FULL_44_10]|nr:MAG: hypothetical protein A3C46_04035 [Deltaproteobacteria bacterium RIFCSPHIGHO2_02_FULL_44_16]OGQ45683.1 MAG: hypothetical protein A3I05_06070 [Deltaproteobacteria bacterium RIFCSPLOWO2_02_FULL_44_10]
MKSQPIEEIREQFDHEWLLIEVDKTDASTTTVLTGRLLEHSPSRDELYRKARQHRGHTMTVYSEDWPDDLAAAF